MFEISDIIDGYKFVKRTYRYMGVVENKGTEERVYIANPGRLKELLIKGSPVFIKKADDPKRKTQFDLLSIQPEKPIVCIDTRVPNWIFEDHLSNNKLKELTGYSIKKKEYKIGNSKIDYLLEKKDNKCLVELKLCTLLEEGKLLFPDAVSARSSKHLLELINATKQGYRVIVYFVGLRGDPTSFGPNGEVDPEFKAAFDRTVKSDVEIIALKTEIKYEKSALRFSDLESIAVES